MTNIKYNKISEHSKTIIMFWFLLLVLIIGMSAYLYFVRTTIINIVKRQDLESNRTALASKVSQLESNYITVKNSVTINTAKAMGFANIDSPKFVTRDSSVISSLSVVSVNRQ